MIFKKFQRSVTSSPNSLHQGDKLKKKNGGTLRKKLASPVFGYEASKRPSNILRF